MAENKTQITNHSVEEYLESIEHPQRKIDSKIIFEIHKEITGQKPVMWGESMIGFGSYHYKYDSGREGDFFTSGFAARKQNIAVYVMMGFSKIQDKLEKLGKHKTGSCCLYITRLSNIDIEVLKDIIKTSHEHMQTTYNS